MYQGKISYPVLKRNPETKNSRPIPEKGSKRQNNEKSDYCTGFLSISEQEQTTWSFYNDCSTIMIKLTPPFPSDPLRENKLSKNALS